jgi:hypothetical protein
VRSASYYASKIEHPLLSKGAKSEAHVNPFPSATFDSMAMPIPPHFLSFYQLDA